MPNRSPRTKPPISEDRRTNRPLRETLDELVEHVRAVARTVHEMTPEEVDYAQQRLEWLADEVWRATTESELT